MHDIFLSSLYFMDVFYIFEINRLIISCNAISHFIFNIFRYFFSWFYLRVYSVICLTGYRDGSTFMWRERKRRVKKSRTIFILDEVISLWWWQMAVVTTHDHFSIWIQLKCFQSNEMFQREEQRQTDVSSFVFYKMFLFLWRRAETYEDCLSIKVKEKYLTRGACKVTKLTTNRFGLWKYCLTLLGVTESVILGFLLHR